MTTLSNGSRLGRISSMFTTFGAAIDVARAIEARRMPVGGSLKLLGIDEKAFRQVNLG